MAEEQWSAHSWHLANIQKGKKGELCRTQQWPSGSFSQFSSVAQSCPTLCDPMNRSTPGLPVHHQLPEFTQTHVHRVSDTIQPSHPLLSPSPPAPKLLWSGALGLSIGLVIEMKENCLPLKIER